MQLKPVALSTRHQRSLDLVRQFALDAFLVETNKSFPVQELNGQIPDLIDSISVVLRKKYRLEKYFS
ncbi:MAG: hypothetical protein ABIJ04_08070 [Bacteroidota bacterium]